MAGFRRISHGARRTVCASSPDLCALPAGALLGAAITMTQALGRAAVTLLQSDGSRPHESALWHARPFARPPASPSGRGFSCGQLCLACECTPPSASKAQAQSVSSMHPSGALDPTEGCPNRSTFAHGLRWFERCALRSLHPMGSTTAAHGRGRRSQSGRSPQPTASPAMGPPPPAGPLQPMRSPEPSSPCDRRSPHDHPFMGPPEPTASPQRMGPPQPTRSPQPLGSPEPMVRRWAFFSQDRPMSCDHRHP